MNESGESSEATGAENEKKVQAEVPTTSTIKSGWMLKLSSSLNSATTTILSPTRRIDDEGEETKHEKSSSSPRETSYLDTISSSASAAKMMLTASISPPRGGREHNATEKQPSTSSPSSSLSAAAESAARYGMTTTAQLAAASAQSAGVAAAWSKASASAAVQSFETVVRRTVAGSTADNTSTPTGMMIPTPPSAAALESLRHLHALALEGVKSERYEPELNAFWKACYSLLVEKNGERLPKYERRSESWKRLGFATENPDDAIRAGGLLSLRAARFLIDRYPEKALYLLREHMPLGEAAIAVCREIARLCDIGSPLGLAPRRRLFWGALEEAETFFELVSIGLSVFGREYSSTQIYDEPNESGRRDNARLAAAVRLGTREIEALLSQAPQSQNDLILLAQTVPASPQHDKITALCGYVANSSSPHYFRKASISHCSTEDDEDEDDALDDYSGVPSPPKEEQVDKLSKVQLQQTSSSSSSSVPDSK